MKKAKVIINGKVQTAYVLEDGDDRKDDSDVVTRFRLYGDVWKVHIPKNQ